MIKHLKLPEKMEPLWILLTAGVPLRKRGKAFSTIRLNLRTAVLRAIVTFNTSLKLKAQMKDPLSLILTSSIFCHPTYLKSFRCSHLYKVATKDWVRSLLSLCQTLATSSQSSNSINSQSLKETSQPYLSRQGLTSDRLLKIKEDMLRPL
jgi:hypothetical protein